MAQIGYGYGSEFQLLRFLGHHRNELESAIVKATKAKSKDFFWFDFDYADRNKVVSGDAEMVGLSFLKESNGRLDSEKIEEVLRKMSQYKWAFDRWQYWDAVFILDGTLYFVEAKAHKDELKSGNKKHGGKSTSQILELMKKTFPNKRVTEEWLKDYYQFANRISTAALLNQSGLQCRLLNIYFIDGYFDREHNISKDTSEAQFKDEIEKEHEALGLSYEDLKNLVVDVFIDANPYT